MLSAKYSVSNFLSYDSLMLYFHTASDDLLDVLEQLQTLRQDKFWYLGLKLGLLDSTLDNLSDDSPKTFGRTVMQAWLNQEDNVKEPSWKSLVEALKSDIVKEKPTAQNVLDWLKSR